jgi:hypothetical protein
MAGRYECDCGAVYSHPDQLISCASSNHGAPPRRLSPQQLYAQAHQALQALDDWANVNETEADAMSEWPIPWQSFYRVKTGQALKAIEELSPTIGRE